MNMMHVLSRLPMCILALVFATSAFAADQPAPLATQGTVAELRYGQDDSLPAPKTLIFSINPDRIIADAHAWKAMGVDGFFMDGVANEWSSDVWAADGKPYTIGESDETFQKVRQAVDICTTLDMEVFVKTVYANPLEWFNDTAWQQINHNFKQIAIFARESGCKGIALDIEYIGQQYAFEWTGYDYVGYTRQDLVCTIRARSTELLRSMYREFPDMVFLILPEESFTLGTHIETAWVEEAARTNAPGGVHLFMESTYTSSDIRRTLAHASAANQLFRRLLSPAAQDYWREHCSLASGVWPTGFDVLEHSSASELPGELRESWAASLMVSPQYNWIYLDRFAEQHMGRSLDTYKGVMDFAGCARILREKQVVTDEAYVSIARTLRTLPAEDFAAELGSAPVPRFMFPYAVPMLELSPVGGITPEETEREWRNALDYYAGVRQDLTALYRPVSAWQIIGPFPSGEGFVGHSTVFAPEQGIDLDAEYDGVNGKVSWQPFHLPVNGLGIDFKAIYEPSEHVTAYALCWVNCPTERTVQARFSTNDAGKLWIDGKLVDDFDHESWSILDRDIIPITLPQGRTPILAKVTNGIGSWSLVLRFTDSEGNPVDDLTVTAAP